MGADHYPPKQRSCFQRYRCLIILIVLVVVAAAVAVPLVLIKPWEKNNSPTGSNNSNQGNPPGNNNNNGNNNNGNNNNNNNTNTNNPGNNLPTNPITPSTDNTAKVNSYTPALDQPFDYAGGSVKIRGVNLGGWLVLEPFITPSLFDPYAKNNVIDESTLCKHLGPEAAKALLEKHYQTWVTEATFIKIKEIGLNHVRIPLGFWALGGLKADEPYVASVSWKYLLMAIEWARKYGIRVMVELHAAPGSQNGWNHSGRVGPINWIDGPQGEENAQRTLFYISQLASFFSTPAYSHVTPIMGLLNEPAGFIIGGDKVKDFYKQAYDTFRKATGPAKGPWAIFHDGFLGHSSFSGFLAGSDRVMLDLHQYIMFNVDLMNFNQTKQLDFACSDWGSASAEGSKTFGPTMVAEFSVATNDCATHLNGIGVGARWEGKFPGEPPVQGNQTCTGQNNASTFTPEYKAFLTNYFKAQVEAFERGIGWFYWNFKTESNPLWSYFDGVDNGWLPKDANNRGPNFCKF